jgi:hypothetical protein
MGDKVECRGKWFLLIISTIFQLVKFLVRKPIYDEI